MILLLWRVCLIEIHRDFFFNLFNGAVFFKARIMRKGLNKHSRYEYSANVNSF